MGLTRIGSAASRGVFWIQRFQDNDGESGGLQSAVWWAWLRQDVWVAMRERRHVFSCQQPKRTLSPLTAAELATRATYLLSQCVNYASKEEQETSDLSRRLERGSELLFLLQEWYYHLLSEYNPLPMASETAVFPQIWVHPPSYAAALQIYSLARVLVALHRPSSGGLDDYRAAQKLLTLSVNRICGIARTVDELDEAANIVSLHCVHDGMSLGRFGLFANNEQLLNAFPFVFSCHVCVYTSRTIGAVGSLGFLSEAGAMALETSAGRARTGIWKG